MKLKRIKKRFRDRGGITFLPGTNSFKSELGVLPLDTGESLRETKAIVDSFVPSLPSSVQDGFKDAFEKSADRVISARDEKRIKPTEASEALEMLREIGEGFSDLEAGDYEVVNRTDFEKGFTMRFRAPDGDVFDLSMREEKTYDGQARVSLFQREDDGVRLPGRKRMGVRLDLADEGASVDVQFGRASLDHKIHGPFIGADGEIVEKTNGTIVGDHHFVAGLPSSLSLPENFAETVRSFRAKVEGQVSQAV